MVSGYVRRESRLPAHWLPTPACTGKKRERVFTEEAGNQLRSNQCSGLTGGMKSVNMESSSSDEDYLLKTASI